MTYDGSQVQVGWRVRSLLDGWGEVVQVRPDRITVRFGNRTCINFLPDGKFYLYHLNPCLVEMEPPEGEEKQL